MIRRLYKIFYFEVFTYHLYLSKDVVVEEVGKLWLKRAGTLKQPTFKGRFLQYPDSFYLSDNSGGSYAGVLEPEHAILKGTINKISPNETVIEIAVRPNIFYAVLFTLLFLASLYAICNALIIQKLNLLPLPLSTIVFVLPLLIFIAKRVSNKLRQHFEQQLQLEDKHK